METVEERFGEMIEEELTKDINFRLGFSNSLTKYYKEYFYNISGWDVDLVMDYYGEWLGSERAAIKLMLEVNKHNTRMSLSSHLWEMRRLLIDKYGFSCGDIPYTCNYRFNDRTANE